MDLKQIKDRFGSIKGAKVVEGNGGLLAVAVARDGVEGEVYLHGGHVTRWKPASTGDVLFLSDLTNWGATKAIRGGVPICFPWFGPKLDQPIGPQHGFARTREWKLEKIAEASDGIVVEVSDSSDEQTRRLWPHGFRIIHRVTLGPTLKMELEVQNTSEEQFTFEEAQHSYFQVGDVRQIAILGLEGVSLVDKTEGPPKRGHYIPRRNGSSLSRCDWQREHRRPHPEEENHSVKVRLEGDCDLESMDREGTSSHRPRR
jgi:glucose-6-phosphate 1-epimerase